MLLMLPEPSSIPIVSQEEVEAVTKQVQDILGTPRPRRSATGDAEEHWVQHREASSLVATPRPRHGQVSCAALEAQVLSGALMQTREQGWRALLWWHSLDTCMVQEAKRPDWASFQSTCSLSQSAGAPPSSTTGMCHRRLLR